MDIKYLKWVIFVTLFIIKISISAQLHMALIDDEFTSFNNENWKEISLNGAGKGNFSANNKSLTIENTAGKGFYGFHHAKPVSGNFYAEAVFIGDDVAGLALISVKNGVPDTSNYTAICVNKSEGIVFVKHHDMQNGVENVHDPKKVIDSSRYEAKLNGQNFSVPYNGTNGKIRILHESLSNTFHFYYGTRLEKWGIITDDWMELAPQYSWLEPDHEYFVALVALPDNGNNSTKAQFKKLTVVQTPTNDFDDSNTGFQVVKRNFSWSGFEGEATVVSFGKEFIYDKNIKFVIWDRANNAPAWRLTNQFLLNFEFFEGGDDIFPGCHEAMSDRQRHGQLVKIIENNEVRKIIHWHGIPLNPNYNFSGENFNGNQFPYFDEYWTFYPDGTGTRQLIDTPNLDIDHRRGWGPEIIEPMPIGGSLVEAGDICNSPALSVFNMDDPVKTFFPPDKNNEYVKDSWKWDQIVYNCHFKNGIPDFYIVYSQDDKYPELWTGIPIETQIGWHNTKYNFSHWPVGREPYGQNAQDWGKTSRSYASHLNEVTHTSLASAGFYGKLGVDFNDYYEIDENGRKFRRHVMLTGVAEPYNYDEVRNQLQTWLNPGDIKMLNSGCVFVKTDRIYRSLVFKITDGKSKCLFEISPNKTVINPAVTIENWKGGHCPEVLLNGKKIDARIAFDDNKLLVWIPAKINQKSIISIMLTE